MTAISEGRMVDRGESFLHPLSFFNRIWGKILPLMPIFFVVEWLLCFGFFDGGKRFFFYSALLTLATGVLALAMYRAIESEFPLLLLLGVFMLGYYFKFIWLVLTLKFGSRETVLAFFGPYSHHIFLPLLHRDNILRAFALSTWGYVAFCIGVVIVRGVHLMPTSLRTRKVLNGYLLKKARALSSIYLIGALLALFVSGFFINRLGVGIHGYQNAQLPGNLGALINYTHGVVVPGLLIFVLSWSDQRGMRLYWWLAMLGMLLYALSVIFLRASRGALVTEIVIPLGTLWLLYGGLTRKRVRFLLILFLVVVLLRPVFTVYRRLRTSDLEAGIVKVLVKSLQSSDELEAKPVQYNKFLDDLMVVFVRVIGFDSMLYVSPPNAVKIDPAFSVAVLTTRQSLARMFTHEIIGYSENITTHYSAPSLVGGLYLLGGIGGIVGGILFIVVFVQWIWTGLCKLQWWTTPLMLTQVIRMVFSIGVGGTFDTTIRDSFVIFLFGLGLEFISRVKLAYH
jgi:hypothetical protein